MLFKLRPLKIPVLKTWRLPEINTPVAKVLIPLIVWFPVVYTKLSLTSPINETPIPLNVGLE